MEPDIRELRLECRPFGAPFLYPVLAEILLPRPEKWLDVLGRKRLAHGDESDVAGLASGRARCCLDTAPHFGKARWNDCLVS
jgi:hypothetical protein